jgi:subtilase family protein
VANAETPLVESRPLLVFGSPAMGPIPTSTNSSYPPPPRSPDGSRQGERLGPRFSELQAAIAAQRALLTEEAPGDDPELVAVFEVADSVDNFYKAAANVPGLEFLFDADDGPVEADEDFYYVDKHGEPTEQLVPHYLYMVMTNAQALSELISMFQRWQADQSVVFERGLNGLKTVFRLLRDVRRWSAEDRIRETGISQVWREMVAIAGNQTMAAEVELWFRDTPTRRSGASGLVQRAVEAVGGRVVTTSTIEDIRFQGMLIELPRSAVESVLNSGAGTIELLTLEDVMFVSPASQLRTNLGVSEFEAADLRQPDADGKPRVALLDGVPLGNHQLLANRLIIDDPDDRAASYAAIQRRHGTAMASLIIHGPSGAGGTPLARPIYVRPILQPHEFFDNQETFPPDEMFIDLLHRALHRIFEEPSGDAESLTEDIRIVNLSVGDSSRTFIRKMSPHARLLDWFCHKFNILIVVSAGNHDGWTDGLMVTAETLEDSEELQTELLRTLHRTDHHRRLLSPSEGINVVSVGASHSDGGLSSELPSHLIDPLPQGMPASYSPVGFGYRRAIKPEVLLPGGREVLERVPTDEDSSSIQLTTFGGSEVVGLPVAAPGLVGELNGMARTCGTSNAAALASRHLAQLFELFETPGTIHGTLPNEEYHPVMAKALLIHAASWERLGERLTSDLDFGDRARHAVTRVLGYGLVDDQTVGTAATNRVTLLGTGTIGKDQRHTFLYPLPTSLHATAEWRRLTVTLAWISAINPFTQRYKVARLRFAAPTEDLGADPYGVDLAASTRGTVQHQVYEGRRARAFVAGQSLGIDVDCRIDVAPASTRTRYALAVSLEVGPAIRADIHEEVRARLSADIRTTVRERVSS